MKIEKLEKWDMDSQRDSYDERELLLTPKNINKIFNKLNEVISYLNI